MTRCTNSWPPNEERRGDLFLSCVRERGAHKCARPAGHDGRCRCGCGATTQVQAPQIEPSLWGRL